MFLPANRHRPAMELTGRNYAGENRLSTATEEKINTSRSGSKTHAKPQSAPRKTGGKAFWLMGQRQTEGSRLGWPRVLPRARTRVTS